MKPIRMIWVGASEEGHVTTGKTYTIVGKLRETEPFGLIWYSYIFIDDAGNKETAASRLFVKPKPQYGASL